MKVPISDALASGAWFRCTAKPWSSEPEIHFRLRVLEMGRIDLYDVDRPESIEADLTAGILWRLVVEVVNTDKSGLVPAQLSAAVKLLDQDECEFDVCTDSHLMQFSDYAKRARMLYAVGTNLARLPPKIPTVVGLAFVLPDDDDAEYGVSVTPGVIEEV